MSKTITVAPSNPDPLMTVHEAATYSRLSTSLIRRRIGAGILPAVRFGNRALRVRRSDLDHYLTTGDPSVDDA